MKLGLRAAFTAIAATACVTVAACGATPSKTEVATALKGCGIPPGGASLTFGKNRIFKVRAREDLSYKQIMCVFDWAQKKGFQPQVALIGTG
jgi:hypothetical protein